LLLQNELKKLYDRDGENYPEIINKLNIEDFSKEIYEQTKNILDTHKTNFHFTYLHALNDYDEVYHTSIDKLGSKEAFIELKNTYANNQLAKIVKNDREILQYFVHNGHIIKLKDPIFTLPFSKYGRAHFYAPMKRIGNYYYDTFWFDIVFMWLTTIMWFVVLYFDLLFKVIKYFENIRLRRFNRKFLSILGKED
jgi:hypothetical protein